MSAGAALPTTYFDGHTARMRRRMRSSNEDWRSSECSGVSNRAYGSVRAAPARPRAPASGTRGRIGCCPRRLLIRGDTSGPAGWTRLGRGGCHARIKSHLNRRDFGGVLPERTAARPVLGHRIGASVPWSRVSGFQPTVAVLCRVSNSTGVSMPNAE